jgi:hypothetical protein
MCSTWVVSSFACKYQTRVELTQIITAVKTFVVLATVTGVSSISMVGPVLVKFLSLSIDSELDWSHAGIIFPAGFASEGSLNKDATMRNTYCLV